LCRKLFRVVADNEIAGTHQSRTFHDCDVKKELKKIEFTIFSFVLFEKLHKNVTKPKNKNKSHLVLFFPICTRPEKICFFMVY
jgi:hypothetical protein